jgi:hypothetical protein
LLLVERVAWCGSGENMTTRFSNLGSHQSEPGAVPDQRQVGHNGYSLRLDVAELGFNDRARERTS